MRTLVAIACLRAFLCGITGVFEDTFFVGRQYSVRVPPELPHGFPVRLSTHRSFSQRLRFRPASDFLTCPCAYRENKDFNSGSSLCGAKDKPFGIWPRPAPLWPTTFRRKRPTFFCSRRRAWLFLVPELTYSALDSGAPGFTGCANTLKRGCQRLWGDLGELLGCRFDTTIVRR